MRYYLFILILLITKEKLLLVSLVGMTALNRVTKALLVNSNKKFYLLSLKVEYSLNCTIDKLNRDNSRFY